jgi:hypothetical protein
MKIVRESPTFGCDSQEDDIVHKSSAFRRQNPYIYEVIGELSALVNGKAPWRAFANGHAHWPVAWFNWRIKPLANGA